MKSIISKINIKCIFNPYLPTIILISYFILLRGIVVYAESPLADMAWKLLSNMPDDRIAPSNSNPDPKMYVKPIEAIAGTLVTMPEESHTANNDDVTVPVYPEIIQAVAQKLVIIQDEDQQHSSNNSSDVSDLDFELETLANTNDRKIFLEELSVYISDIISQVENTPQILHRQLLYDFIFDSDKSLWMPLTKEEYHSYDSNYSQMQLAMGVAYNIALTENDATQQSIFKTLGVCFMDQAHRAVNQKPTSERLVRDTQYYDLLADTFINRYASKQPLATL